jgi:hypothetical protein
LLSGLGRMSCDEQPVKLDKLVKTLRRDLAANPMKAGLLGVLLLGGSYFWAPLVWKLVGKKGTATPGVAAIPAEPAAVQAAGLPLAQGVGEPKETVLAWREIRNQRMRDPLVQSAEFRPQWNQVFKVADVAAGKPQAESQAPIPDNSNPHALGLVLQGVAIGTKSKKAIINGKVYRELDSITLKASTGGTSDKDHGQPQMQFKLTKIARRMVEVEREGKTWQLKLASSDVKNQQPIEANQGELAHDETTVGNAGTTESRKSTTVAE